MAPIESFFFIIVGLFALISIVRGYARELVNTGIIIFLVFFVTSFEMYGDSALGSSHELIFGVDPFPSLGNMLRCLGIQLAFIAIIFASYAGRTWNFEGIEIPAPLGSLISLLIGLLNGYLVGGTLWYYLHKFGYPYIPEFELPLTTEASRLLSFMPPTIFPSPLLWLLPLIVLVILRIRG